jgi:hypothetical protein
MVLEAPIIEQKPETRQSNVSFTDMFMPVHL